MSTMKLGEMLVRSGLITPAQLEECLKCQVIFGGRLGTNLIEMGYLDEDELAGALSSKFGVPCSTADQLTDIPKEVIPLIPRELVLKYKVIPLQLEKKRLTVAMADPSDIAVIDEISFITGLFIVPLVTPEIRLLHALEKYYDVARETRYINLAGETRMKVKGKDATSARAEEQPPAGQQKPPVQAVEEPDLLELPPMEEFQGFGGRHEADLPAARPQQQPEPETIEEELEIFDLLEHLSRRLVEAGNRDDIAEALVEYAGAEFDRAAILMIKGKTAIGWMARVKEENLPAFSHLQIPLDAPSVLKTVAEGKDFHLGPIPDTPCNTILLNGVGGGRRETSLLMPLLLMGKVVAVLFVDGDAADINLHLGEMKKIVVKASLAFEILILKNKILSA